MKQLKIILTAVLWLICCATPTWANPTASGQQTLSTVLMLPVMALFSALGGYYKIRRQKGCKRIVNIPFGVLAAVMIILSFANVALTLLALIICAIIAFARAVQMTMLGAEVRRQKELPVDFAGIGPWRLQTCGLLLMAATILMTGTLFVYPVGDLSGHYLQGRRLSDLREFVAYQAWYYEANGQYAKIDHQNEALGAFFSDIYRDQSQEVHVHYTPDLKHYTVLLPSVREYPLFYKYLSVDSSFRADDSGQIRMISVHHKGRICPPDAPVVYTVSEEDIQKQSGRTPENRRG
jgi:hypothetical protein